MQFTIRDRYACGITRYWGSMFFEPSYNEPLYREGLAFASFTVLSLEREPSGVVRRRIRVRPKLELPAAIRRVVGDAISYEEHGHFDPHDRHFRSHVVPMRLGDKVTIESDLWLEPINEHESDRVISARVEARVMGLSGLIEKFLERTLRENYARSAEFTARWLAQNPE